MIGSNPRGGSAFVGVGLAGLGEAPGFSHLDLTAIAVRRALDDAGIEIGEVDGLFTSNMVNMFAPLVTGEYLGIQPQLAVGTSSGGNALVDHALAAAHALQAGQCNVALLCYGSNQRTGSNPLMPPDMPANEAIYAPREPISSYALAAARHMHDFGTTRSQMAEVAVAARKWAQLNERAFVRDPLTIDDVLNSRMICDPLSVLDCCLMTDGAGAIVMTRADRAKNVKHKPVYFLGGGTAQTHRQISQMPDLTSTAATITGQKAFAMAKMGQQDIDVLQLYDAFTINVILFLEDLGFCPKGEGGRFVEGGRIAPGGALPVNTNGGGLSCVHPGMYGIFTLIEAVEQLRGTAEERQVDGVETALCHGNGGLLSCQSTAILGTEATL